MYRSAFVLLVLLTATANAVAVDLTTPVDLIGPIDDFTAEDFRGRKHSLSEYSDSRIIVLAFLGTECPLAKLYAPRLEQIATEYRDQGVTVLGINSNSQDSMTEIAAYARQHELSFPILKDLGHVIADRVQAERTPEVAVLDADRKVRYRGRVDDQYIVGLVRDKATREDLRIALDELLAGKSVSVPVTQPLGCYIGRQKKANPDSHVTYSNQVARILQKHCVECHREGEIAPFSLTEYEEVAGWAETIQEVVEEQRMPPWHANPEYGSFVNERRMSDEEKQTLAEWVKNGAPQGDPAKLPPPRDFTEGWRLPREPDQVIAMRDKPFVVAAEGTIEYQYFAVDPHFTEDKWVCATDVVPGNRAVVHHVIVFVSPPANSPRRGLGWMAAYVPGQSSMQLPEGQARFVPAGSKLIFQMHYTPNGSQQSDLTKLGLVFTERDKVKEEVATYVAAHGKFEIPPHAQDYQVELIVDNLPASGRLLAMAPHMHVRGKAYRFSALEPNGGEQILLDIPRYDFNWQNVYALSQPIPLSGDLKIRCTALYDNSEGNLANPDPSATVRWGDQTWEEMMVAFFEVAFPVGQVEKQKRKAQPAGPSDEKQKQAEATARQLFERFDDDKDGKIVKRNVPDTFARFAFRRYDANRDGVITFEEASEAQLDKSGRR